MNCSESPYRWCRRDRLVYSATLIPFLTALAGTAYVLATEAIYLVVIFLLLYAAVNVFQAGCCVGCPYRGRFCPAVFGVYLANLLSATVYRNRTFDQRFFRLNANLAEVSLAATLLFPVYWLATSNWVYVIVYLALVGLHVVTFFPTVCPKCSYHHTCPGGQAATKLFKK